MAEKILSQWEIDALLQSMAGTAEATSATATGEGAQGRNIKPYDFRRPDRFSKDHLRALRTIHEAFHIARTGRPGPVHIDITKDALQQETSAPHPSEEEVIAGLPGFRPTFDGHPRQLRLAAAEIARARRPVILAGHGILIANASAELVEFAPDCEVGALPPIGDLFGVPVYADHAVREDPEISFHAGSHHFTVHVDRAGWERAARVVYADLAEREERPAWET
uniref:YbaK/aminoacyl-tRNA synthetase-associated domain-containing protein n=1 Tax=Thermorudis sp. TaxID=1969470 RepID=A0A7C2W799_9BACT